MLSELKFTYAYLSSMYLYKKKNSIIRNVFSKLAEFIARVQI